jgi:ppGpp synthetase/RelA/SpoT-type nucleotidyltranferase
VDRCGDLISFRQPLPKDPEEWNKAVDEELKVFFAWRDLHAFPLDSVAKTLIKRTRQIDPTATFGQRLKRYRSIRDKLKNSPAMQLTTMQDIAGCRAVVDTVKNVYVLKHKYEDYAKAHPNTGPELISKWTKDYILHPKQDGYRSLHLVLKYRTSRSAHSHFCGLRVEIQIRSQLQHAWATAVETASAVTNQALKAGIGEEDWKRFFRLMGDFIAWQEDSHLLSGTSDFDLRKQAASLAIKLKVVPLLEGMRHVVQDFKGSGKDELYLLILNSHERRIRYWSFKESEFTKATEAYSAEEKAHRDNLDVHVVLVKVASIEDLREAYPSYFLDSTNFVQQVKRLVSEG